jgi:precorrin-3B C17-methyltransferase
MKSEKGTLYLVGIGPGNYNNMTTHCSAVLKSCDVVVGYARYVELVRAFIGEKKIISSGMRHEAERCYQAINEADSGKVVALISSGDAGVYGMAGLALEIIEREKLWDRFDLEIVPGIPAIHAAAAGFGAPLMNDYAVVSLSDLLVPWEMIVKRLTYALRADFVVCLYNPGSTRRTHQIKEAHSLMLDHRGADTPVGIARNVGRKGESLTVTTLGKMLHYKIDMVTIIIVGNSTTVFANEKMITPRGYSLNSTKGQK